jgi:peptidyl-prolyl cis-trans isomerase A (cyclophilin A)
MCYTFSAMIVSWAVAALLLVPGPQVPAAGTAGTRTIVVFSIVIGDQPEMDFAGHRNRDGQGFAVFGRVVRGMEVVKAIQASPTGPRGPYGPESLDPPIKIVKAYRR